MAPAPSIVPPVPWLRLFVEVLTAVLLGDRDREWSAAPPLDTPSSSTSDTYQVATAA